MRKIDEFDKTTSCWNKAKDDELLFVLLGRDKATPQTIRFWVGQRIQLGKNVAGDAQTEEAMALANQIEMEQAK